MKKWVKRFAYLLLIIFVFLNVVAAFHAYKFTHFYKEKDFPRKKLEHMTGWEKTKMVLFGMDYAKRTISEVPSHVYTDFSVTTSDKLKLNGWYIPVDSSRGTVIMFHGHGATRSGVVTEANAFHDMGYNVCMIDFRAHGSSEGNVCTIGEREVADVIAAFDYVISKGEKNVVLWGVSLGAATILKTLNDHPEIQPSKIILEMPFGSLTEAVKGRLRLMNLPEQPFATLLTFWGGAEQGFWAFGLRPSEYARAVKMPVLLQWGKNDSRVTEGETNSIYNNLSSAEKRLVIYDNSGHESLLKKEPAKWLTQVTAFLSP